MLEYTCKLESIDAYHVSLDSTEVCIEILNMKTFFDMTDIMVNSLSYPGLRLNPDFERL